MSNFESDATVFTWALLIIVVSSMVVSGWYFRRHPIKRLPPPEPCRLVIAFKNLHFGMSQGTFVLLFLASVALLFVGVYHLSEWMAIDGIRHKKAVFILLYIGMVILPLESAYAYIPAQDLCRLSHDVLIRKYLACVFGTVLGYIALALMVVIPCLLILVVGFIRRGYWG